MAEFSIDLSTVIQKVAADHPEEPSPQRIAALVLELIPAEHYAGLLAKLLPQYVGQTLRRTEHVPATSPRIDWEDTLGERVPTQDGYRFLRDCSAEDVRAGAKRRRTNAEALNRRADLYDAIAQRLDEGELHVPSTKATPADLGPEVGAEIIIRHSGYRWPWGSEPVDTLPPERKPTINEILDEVAYVPSDILVSQLRERLDLLDKLAVGSARGWTSAEIDQILESTELIEPFYQALLRVHSNLNATASIKRLEHDERTRKRLGKDIRAVRERLTAVHTLLKNIQRAAVRPTAIRGPDEKRWRAWSRDLTRQHKEMFERELESRLEAAGLPDQKHVVPMPAEPDRLQFALDHGLVEPLTSGTTTLAVHRYTDAAFSRLVGEDIAMQADPDEGAALRHPMNQDRWQAALKAAADTHRERNPSDESARVRAGRFHQALMQRQGEVKRLQADLVQRIRAYLTDLNRVPERRRIIDDTIVWLAHQVGEEPPIAYDPTWLAPKG
ncbi:hypothetical protein [Nocardioides luteus]|uniref:hypothetical protein n=1 Tax=Nocardioides luteus TaxID=1844 RepID=UPI0018CA6C05|nr:hypothetical protein [Nocardioides luteus]MBG6099070.1 hypothetical protein [Nocardioides luteus]